jgi:hypothetical protein
MLAMCSVYSAGGGQSVHRCMNQCTQRRAPTMVAQLRGLPQSAVVRLWMWSALRVAITANGRCVFAAFTVNLLCNASSCYCSSLAFSMAVNCVCQTCKPDAVNRQLHNNSIAITLLSCIAVFEHADAGNDIDCDIAKRSVGKIILLPDDDKTYVKKMPMVRQCGYEVNFTVIISLEGELSTATYYNGWR